MSARSVRTVRDGKNILRFYAEALGSGTSERPGVSRWSEVMVYGLGDQQYVVAKIGRSTLVHRPECIKANPRTMLPYAEARKEALVRRTACPECLPAVDHSMDPHTLLEATRYTKLQARGAQQLIDILLGGRADPAEIIQEVLRQVCKNDVDVADIYERSRS